jgi:5-methylcytosine-specific restriction endonuclease McrA
MRTGCLVAEQTCPLCGRVLGTVNIDRHHLVPKKFKGKEQFAIHKICHRKIHSAFTERELLQTFHTWDALRQHEDIQAFIAWVSRKPPEYYSRTATSNKKKNK